MWVADRVVAPTLGSAITIPETANEFAIKGNHLTLVKGNQFDGRTKTDPHKHIHEFLKIYDMFKYRDTENEAVRLMMFPLSLTGEAKTWLNELNEGTIETWGNIIKIFYHGLNEITQEVLNGATGGIFLYKTPNQAYQLLEDKVILKLDLAKNQKTKTSLKKTVAFADEGISNTDTDKIMARMDAMTIKIDAHYKELQSRAKQPTPNLDDDDIAMSREEESKFMQTFLAKNHQASIQNLETKFDKLADKQSGRPFGSLPSNTQPNPRENPNEEQNKTENPINFDSDDEDDEPRAENMLVEVGKFTFPANSIVLEMEEDIGIERMIFNIDSAMKHSYSNDDTCFSIDVIDEILEEDFDALLDEGSKILRSIEGTLLEEEIFSEFNEFIAMAEDENSKSESDTEEPPFEKITINTD
ncbi:hypothetical protein Tco_0149014 [Tanacetum coccineum]